MTVCAILFGLVPIMWSPMTESGADVMKRIAAPMIGGAITTGIIGLCALSRFHFCFLEKKQLTQKTLATF